MKKLGFVLFPALSLGVGALAGYLTSTGLETVYPALEKSALTPPGWAQAGRCSSGPRSWG